MGLTSEQQRELLNIPVETCYVPVSRDLILEHFTNLMMDSIYYAGRRIQVDMEELKAVLMTQVKESYRALRLEHMQHMFFDEQNRPHLTFQLHLFSDPFVGYFSKGGSVVLTAHERIEVYKILSGNPRIRSVSPVRLDRYVRTLGKRPRTEDIEKKMLDIVLRPRYEQVDYLNLSLRLLDKLTLTYKKDAPIHVIAVKTTGHQSHKIEKVFPIDQIDPSLFSLAD
jgi:hypothetical protein